MSATEETLEIESNDEVQILIYFVDALTSLRICSQQECADINREIDVRWQDYLMCENCECPNEECRCYYDSSDNYFLQYNDE